MSKSLVAGVPSHHAGRIDQRTNGERLNALTLRHSIESEREWERHLQSQKAEYEAIIQRHLKFIDQVCDDGHRFHVRTARSCAPS